VPKLRISAVDGWYDPVATFRAANGFDPLDWQVPYLGEERNSIVLKGRQVGCSTCGAAKCIRACRMFDRFLSLIISPSLKQSEEVLLRAKSGLERIGERLVADSASQLELENGSRIVSLPGSAKSARGWSANILIIDEAAFIDLETYLAVRATVAATGGQTITQSTPAAPFGHFYDAWQSGVDYHESLIEGTTIPDPTVKLVRYHVSSEEVETIDKAFLASERARLNEDEYAQEYLGKFKAPGLGLVDPERLKDMTLREAGLPGVTPADPFDSVK